ncbi:MAG: nitrilase [Deltaproteobacteria bacterium]|nr:nitrilase [Deltaproteobacteria bacterium]
MKDIRIAAVISHSPVNKIRHNLDQMVRLAGEAKKKGASIICYPEMNITGYSTREDIIDAAEPVPGPITREIVKLAESELIVILAGIAEKDSKGRIFASHLVIKPHEPLSVYRKLHISPPERTIFTPGNKIPLFESHGVKFGIQLCYDAHFPELSTYMAINGADIIFIPHASPRGTPDEKFRSWMRHLPARAYDNGLFVIACNQTGDNGKGLGFPGIAMIIGPSGEVLSKNLNGKQGMLIYDLKMDELNRVRNHRMRFFLPNRRPELYLPEPYLGDR